MTTNVSTFPPYTVVTVIIASPGVIALTKPFSTVATFSLLDVQVTSLLKALLGKTTTSNVTVSFTSNIASFPFVISTLVGKLLTSTKQVASNPPSTVVAVIIASPTATPTTSPFTIVTTDGLLDVHVTSLIVAFVGNTVASNVKFSPTPITASSLFKEILVTLLITVTTHVAS